MQYKITLTAITTLFTSTLAAQCSSLPSDFFLATVGRAGASAYTNNTVPVTVEEYAASDDGGTIIPTGYLISSYPTDSDTFETPFSIANGVIKATLPSGDVGSPKTAFYSPGIDPSQYGEGINFALALTVPNSGYLSLVDDDTLGCLLANGGSAIGWNTCDSEFYFDDDFNPNCLNAYILAISSAA